MPLEMRELKGDDLFSLLGIVGKLNIKDEFIQLFEDNTASVKTPQDHKKKQPTKKEKEQLEKEAERRGMEAMAGLLQKVLMNARDIKSEINVLLADLTGADIEEIQNLNLNEYTGLIMDFFKKPELRNFFISIASLLQ